MNIEENATTDASTQTEIGALDGNSSESPTTTLVSTPSPSSPVNAHNEQQDVTGSEDVVLGAVEEQVQVPNAANEALAENQLLRDENTELKSSIANLARLLSREQSNTAVAEEGANAAEARAHRAEATAAESEGLQTELDEADKEISGLDNSNNNLRLQVTALQTEVQNLELDLEGAFSRNLLLERSVLEQAAGRDELEFTVADLRNAAEQMSQDIAERDNLIQMGYQDFVFRNELGTSLHARVIEAERLTNGALGGDDRVMRLAATWFPIAGTVVSDSDDTIDEDVDDGGHEPRVQCKGELAIEGIPGHKINHVNAGVQEDEAADSEGFSFNFDFQNVASPTAHTAASEVTPQDSTVPAFNFAFGNPTQVAESEVHDTAKDSGFTFGFGAPQVAEPEVHDTVEDSGFTFNFGTPQVAEPEVHDTAKDSGFTFAFGTPQVTEKEVHNTAKDSGFTFAFGTSTQQVTKEAVKKPIFDFGETSAQASPQKAGSTAKKPAFQFSTPSVQGPRQETPLGKTAAGQLDNPEEEHGQNFEFAASVPLFGTQTGPNPSLSEGADSNTSNFASGTDFSFDLAPGTGFEFGSSSAPGIDVDFGSGNEVDSSNESKQAASIFDAAASVNLSFPSAPAVRGSDGYCPDPNENTDYLYEIEEGYTLPVQESTEERVDTASATISADEQGLVPQVAQPAFPAGANEAGRDVWSRGRTAEELYAAWEAESPEETTGVDGQEPWREVPAATRAVTDSGAERCLDPTVPLGFSEGAAQMLETAPVTIRNADGHSNFIAEGAVEETFQYAMGGLANLSDLAAQPPPEREFDPEVHFLSGDWIARLYSVNRSYVRSIVRTQEIMIEDQSQTRCEETRVTEDLNEGEQEVEQEVEQEIDLFEQERAEPEVAEESDQTMVAPQPTLELEQPATPTAPEPVPERPAQRRSGGLYIWSLRRRN